jgi:hypothetical protein
MKIMAIMDEQRDNPGFALEMLLFAFKTQAPLTHN